MEKISKYLNWLETEKTKDNEELNKEKIDIINSIKKINKKDLFPKKDKQTLWIRIKKLISGQPKN